MSQSRRNLLKYMAALPLGAAPMAALSHVMVKARPTHAVTAAVDLPITVTVAVSFTGPFAFVADGDDITVYAADAENHTGAVHTWNNETPLHPHDDYLLSGLHPAVEATKQVSPPLHFDIPKPYKEADQGCKFSIRLQRPDVIIGLRPVPVYLSEKPSIPPGTPMRTLPIGVRFVYRGVPSDVALRLTGANNFLFEPDFVSEQSVGMTQYEMAFQLVPEHTADPCHADAKASFQKMLAMFPTINLKTIQFANEDPNCKTQIARLSTVAFRSSGHPSTRLIPVVGGGNDCQSPVLSISPGGH